MSGAPVTGNLIAAIYCARVFLLCIGCFAIAWFVVANPIFVKQSAAEKITKSIAAGQSFKVDSIAAIRDVDTPEFGKWARPSALHNSAVIQLWFLERAFSAGDQKNVDELMRNTGGLMRQALANAPSDPLIWLVLFWIENARSGFSRDHLDYLQMSYSVGPSEGWIGVKRNRFAVALFSALPSEIADKAIAEFTRIIGSGYFTEAADILGGPGWPVQEKLVSRLKELDEFQLRAFDRVLFRRGYNIVIPGLERPEWRPWQ